MNMTRLYKALVLGGAMLTTGCATGATETKRAAGPTGEPKAANDCNKICKGSGMSRFCPTLDGKSANCCWLSNQHPCCKR